MFTKCFPNVPSMSADSNEDLCSLWVSPVCNADRTKYFPPLLSVSCNSLEFLNIRALDDLGDWLSVFRSSHSFQIQMSALSVEGYWSGRYSQFHDAISSHNQILPTVHHNLTCIYNLWFNLADHWFELIIFKVSIIRFIDLQKKSFTQPNFANNHGCII